MIKSDLRNFVTAEEAFFSDSTYYTDATTLVAKNSVTNSSGVGVPAVTSDGAGSCTARHPFFYTKRFTNSRAVLATSRQPLSMVSA
jgi:hypothetical protein